MEQDDNNIRFEKVELKKENQELRAIRNELEVKNEELRKELQNYDYERAFKLLVRELKEGKQ